MIKTKGGSPGPRISRWSIAVLTAAAVCVGALTLAGGAAAAPVSCAGKLVPNHDFAALDHNFDFRFHCDQEVTTFSVVSSRQLIAFGGNAQPYLRDEPTGKLFYCGGPTPGSGFGCTHGQATPNTRVVGSLAVAKDPCARHRTGDRWKVWVTVTTSETLSTGGSAFPSSSSPFLLGGSCKPAAPRALQP